MLRDNHASTPHAQMVGPGGPTRCPFTSSLLCVLCCCVVQVKARLLKMGALSSMNIFLKQEVDRMQRIIGAVRTSLVDLKLAIEGTIIMSEVSRKTFSLISLIELMSRLSDYCDLEFFLFISEPP